MTKIPAKSNVMNATYFGMQFWYEKKAEKS